jgi:hypothetical protein
VPQDTNADSSAKSAPVGSESLMVDKPLSPPAEKTTPEPRSPQAQRMHKSPLVPVVLRLLQQVPPWAKTLWVLPQARSEPGPQKHLPRAPGPMDLGLSVGIYTARAHPCLSPKNHRSNILGLQSLCGTTLNLFGPDSTAGGM